MKWRKSWYGYMTECKTFEVTRPLAPGDDWFLFRRKKEDGGPCSRCLGEYQTLRNAKKKAEELAA